MSVGVLSGLVGLAVLLGATTQRITGLGFALVSSPVLVLLIGATNGVPLMQVLGIMTSLTVMAVTFRDIAWGKAIALIIPAAFGLLPGWWIAKSVPEPVLLILIGLMVIGALLAMLADERARVFRGLAGLLGAGFLSGFMNVIASVGGPAMVLYKMSTDWHHKEFVATLQVYFIALSTGTLLALGWPPLPGEVWVGALVGLAGGLVLGHVLSRKIPAEAASRMVIAVAMLGAVATVIQGVAQVLG